MRSISQVHVMRIIFGIGKCHIRRIVCKLSSNLDTRFPETTRHRRIHVRFHHIGGIKLVYQLCTVIFPDHLLKRNLIIIHIREQISLQFFSKTKAGWIPLKSTSLDAGIEICLGEMGTMTYIVKNGFLSTC